MAKLKKVWLELVPCFKPDVLANRAIWHLVDGAGSLTDTIIALLCTAHIERLEVPATRPQRSTGIPTAVAITKLSLLTKFRLAPFTYTESIV